MTPALRSVPILRRLARGVEDAAGLDPHAARIRRVADAVVPSSGRVRAELHGRSIGHAAHAALTDLPVGLWTSAAVLDLTAGDQGALAARRLVGLGVLATVPTVLTGLADYLAVDGKGRRVGAAHASLNGVATALYGASWLLRRKGRRGAGMAASTLGLAIGGTGAFLGGHLAHALREPPAGLAVEDAPADSP
ncbi:DUF2231 domain-containing protein [Oerskovia flava]|uniref:DUF2231 domain-containing protein n=1 Tax=Oerskovia flava TaxID=2986422 RepID=UPI00223EB05B|nr:DUF2231 domain-containing protein [Oerskovia sp. JB1-3-2]